LSDPISVSAKPKIKVSKAKLACAYKLIYEKKRCEIKEDFEMGEKPKTTDHRNMHAIILGVLGIILLIAGVAIATIHSHLRGSGLGTLCIVVGVVLLIIALLRFYYKRA
jgi:Flp pilus assembly protein TadB